MVVNIHINNTNRDKRLKCFTLNGCKYLIGMKVRIDKAQIISKFVKGSVSSM